MAKGRGAQSASPAGAGPAYRPAEAKLIDEAGRLVAHATSTYLLLPIDAVA